MAKYGLKHICSVCGCKFYDLNRTNPVCPKCGTAPKKLKGKKLSLVDVSKGPSKVDNPENSTDINNELDSSLWDNIEDVEDETDF